MTKSLSRFRSASAARKTEDGGFSFIELLAYMAIAALLILAAIPQFNQYRQKAIVSNMQSDARNIAVSIEAEYTSSLAYPASAMFTKAGTTSKVVGTATGVTVSDNATTVAYAPILSGAGQDTFTLTLANAKVTKTVVYKSADGGLVN